MQKAVCLLFIFFLKTIVACECPPLEPINEQLCTDYNVIFYGKVDSVTAGTEKGFNTVYFSIKELYKGNVPQQLQINFDASSSCMMSFLKNEEWLIYANYKKFDYLTVSLCGHSRKFFNDASNDFYQTTAQRTFDEEKQFLQNTLHIHPFAKVNTLNEQRDQFKPQNIQPEPINKIWLLLVSVISMGIVLVVTRKKK